MLEMYNDVLTPDDVCEILLISKNRLYQLLNAKVLIGYREGSHWRITKQAVINYLSQRS
ncbi:MAG: helix-turn-helix domain-containing protein [Dorea sp.]